MPARPCSLQNLKAGQTYDTHAFSPPGAMFLAPQLPTYWPTLSFPWDKIDRALLETRCLSSSRGAEIPLQVEKRLGQSHPGLPMEGSLVVWLSAPKMDGETKRLPWVPIKFVTIVLNFCATSEQLRLYVNVHGAFWGLDEAQDPRQYGSLTLQTNKRWNNIALLKFLYPTGTSMAAKHRKLVLPQTTRKQAVGVASIIRMC